MVMAKVMAKLTALVMVETKVAVDKPSPSPSPEKERKHKNLQVCGYELELQLGAQLPFVRGTHLNIGDQGVCVMDSTQNKDIIPALQTPGHQKNMDTAQPSHPPPSIFTLAYHVLLPHILSQATSKKQPFCYKQVLLHTNQRKRRTAGVMPQYTKVDSASPSLQKRAPQ